MEVDNFDKLIEAVKKPKALRFIFRLDALA